MENISPNQLSLFPTSHKLTSVVSGLAWMVKAPTQARLRVSHRGGGFICYCSKGKDLDCPFRKKQ